MNYYEGYGKRYTVAGWARVLGLPYVTLYQYLRQGLTPEEIVAKRGVEDIQLDAGARKKRVEVKPRATPRQTELKEQVEELLDRSGYDPEGVEIKVEGTGAYRYRAVWNGMTVGLYNAGIDTFRLTGAGELGLRNPYVEEQTIFHKGGKWYATEETKKAVARKFQRELRRKVQQN